MTKTQAVLDWLREHASISSMEAIKQFGATRLSAHIFNLRKAGYDIETVMCEGRDRFGNPTRFARYYLRDSPVDSGENVL
jgi:hypothetical protein